MTDPHVGICTPTYIAVRDLPDCPAVIPAKARMTIRLLLTICQHVAVFLLKKKTWRPL